MATSVYAEGKFRVMKAANQQAPELTLLDKEGNPTIEPDGLYERRGQSCLWAANRVTRAICSISWSRSWPGCCQAAALWAAIPTRSSTTAP